MFSDINDSELIGSRYSNVNGTVVIIWHEARGDSWPDDIDYIWYVWEDDGNTGSPSCISWAEFRSDFRLQGNAVESFREEI